jgi:putative membrane protein
MKTNIAVYSLALCGVLGFSHAIAAEGSHHKSALTDNEFATKAAAGGLTEVALGTLATQNGGSQDVKDFGAKMVADHGKANDNLKAVAAKNSITIPDKPTTEQQAMIDKMSKETGAVFDKAYIRGMVKAHIADKALFAQESTDGKNADLEQFASDTLPVIKEHLSMIEGMAGSGSSGMTHHAKKSMAAGSPDTDTNATPPGTSAESKSGVGPGANANPGTTPQ